MVVKKQSEKKNGLGMPLVISIALHAVLLVVLLWNADFSSKPKHTAGSMVQAVVIDPNLIKQQANQIKQQRADAQKKEQDRLDKLRRESELLEKNRKAEEERIRKLKEQQAKEAKAAREAEKRRKQKEQEQKLAEEKARQAEAQRKAKEAAAAKAEQARVAKEKAAQEAAEKARQQQLEAQKAEELAKQRKAAAEKAERERVAKEKAAAEAAEKARKEQERLKQLEQEKKEREAALANIFEGLESEAEQNMSARSQYVTSEVDRYAAIYIQLIQQNLLLDDTFIGRECRINLQLTPTGKDAFVRDVKVLNGDGALCRAAQSAIAKVGTFPLPEDEPDVAQKLRDINLTVVPQ